MAAVELTHEVLKERLEEARRSYKLNVGYAALTALPPGFVEQAKRHNARILELELSSNKLSDLPAEIGELQQLRVVRLKYNNLTRIPEVLTKLPALEVVELSGNQITTLDDAVLSRLGNVRDLDLSNNAIGEVGEGVTRMSALQVLQLENNRIDALPDNMGACKSLIKLDLSTNNLHSLPDSMGKLRKIQRLNLGNNMLRRVPPSMGHLKTIKELDLRYNNLDEAYRSKSEEGLSRFLAFLREEEERERLEEIERLKPIGTQVGIFTEYRCKAEAAQVTRLEDGTQRVTDNRCWIRSGHSVTQKGSMLFVFGGLVTKEQVKTNDLFWMSTDRMEWHLQPTTGERPCARDDHCAVWDDTSNKLVIFGGRSQEKKRLNDVHFLDTETWTWHKAVTEGAVPLPRCSASAVIMEGQLILFGGSAAGTRLNDVFLLDLHSWQWQQLTMTGTAPSPRQGSAIALQGVEAVRFHMPRVSPEQALPLPAGSQLFVQGGRNNFVLEDMFVLDLLRKEWTEALPGAKGTPARHGHLMAVHADHLYLYGGYDELGAYSDSMFRLPVPYGQAFTAASRLEWVEMNAEVVYNRCRTAVCHVGQIGMYQVGSPSLGSAASQEEIERAAVSWDTFKTAKLQELKPKPIDEESLRPRNAKLQRVQHCLTSQLGKMPRSHVSHTRKEAAMLDYIASWAAAFAQLYPQRRPLLIAPKNECGQPKVVCTSVRPTVLPYPELYTLPGLVRCVADYFAYEPLERPVHMPEYLVSPTSAINWQAGDSFDLSTVLCSLLIGAGFDAYVVAGYAPQAITCNDQAATQCPALEQEAPVQPPASPKRKVERLKSTKSQGDPKYSIKSGAKLESKFLLDQKIARQQQQQQPAAADASAEANGTPRASTGAAAPQIAAAPAPGPPARNKLVHAWVLVMAGRRQVSEALYIEPSTGRQYAVKQSPYEGVEYLWNNQNFWVCMQMPEPHSDSRASAAALSLDLRNSSKWESLLYEPLPKGLEDDGQELVGMEAGGRLLSQAFSRANFAPGTRPGGSLAARTPRGGKLGVPVLQQGTAAAAAMAVAGTERSSSITSESRRASEAGSRAGDRPGDTQRDRQPGTGRERDRDGSDAAPESTGLPDMPPSWVNKLVIPRDCLDMRCPKGVKSTLYHRCQHEIFALFGECARWDGMVERITLYEDDLRTVLIQTSASTTHAESAASELHRDVLQDNARTVPTEDDARTVPTEVREINRRRRDKLVERRVFPQRETSMESFDQGACGGLRNITVVKGEQRRMDFFPAARLDGLVQRVEKIGEKMTEVFLGRDDHLVYRSIRYGDLPAATPEGDGRRGAPALATRQPSSKKKADKHTRPIVKMTEKFSRRSEFPAHLDVAKRVFYSAQGQIRLDYHYAGDRISHDSRLFTREGLSQLVQVEPLAPIPPAGALMEDYQRQLEAEGACLQAARDSEKEVRELLAAWEREERSISLVTPYYDAVREKHGESDEEPEEAVNTQANYLTPFMPPLVGARQLTRAEALEVREKCLKALKDRLVERANIIQARHDEETASLAKRQATFQRDRDQMTREEEEEYEHACEECLFRIHILDKRLKRHEEQALQKYFELDNKIRSPANGCSCIVTVRREPMRKPKSKKKDKVTVHADEAPSVPDAAPAQQAQPMVWRPDADDKAEEDMMDYDPTAYDCLHHFALEWPCLSLDILRDELGGPRSAFPHSLYMVAGTQAASAKRNYLALIKLADIKQGRHGAKAGAGDNSDDDLLSESDEEVEDPPQMHLRMQALPCAVNRVRSMPQKPGVTALWGEDGQVQVFDLTSAVEELQSKGSKPSKNQTLQLAPLQAHRHAAEGYALDWSPQAAGQLATGDCKRHLHVWSPTPAGSWEVSAPYKGHTQSVEDLQWSPTEPNVLASCSVDGTMRIWDTRERGRSMLSVAASGTDVNVISWSSLTTYILASGDDAGVMRVWDLRNLADGAHVANFAYHRSAITSIEWATHENSVLATTSSDGQLAIWDLAVERDPEEEANLAPDNNAAAPDDLPPQLMFVHGGQQDMKEAHWHPQIPGMMVSTAADGFNVFRPAPGPLNI